MKAGDGAATDRGGMDRGWGASRRLARLALRPVSSAPSLGVPGTRWHRGRTWRDKGPACGLMRVGDRLGDDEAVDQEFQKRGTQKTLARRRPSELGGIAAYLAQGLAYHQRARRPRQSPARVSSLGAVHQAGRRGGLRSKGALEDDQDQGRNQIQHSRERNNA